MPIVFNAVKGNQRNTTYYSTNISFGEVQQFVSLPEDVLKEDLLNKDNTMQRAINWNRVNKNMVPYLLKDDAFFSSITLFIIPRDFLELEEGHGYEFRNFSDLGDNIGQLTIEGSMTMFPADGQHRVATIMEVLKLKPELASISIPAILIPFKSKGQVRQYFSDLNLHAQKASRSIGLTFETRDPIALITKELEKKIPIFKDAINHFSTSLSSKSKNIITINTLYACTSSILKGLKIDVDSLRDKGQDDQMFKEALHRVTSVWNKVINVLPGFKSVREGDMTPGEMRDQFIHPHGVGWQAVMLAASEMIKNVNEIDWQARFEFTCKKINWKRDNPEWQSVCMIGDRMNNTSSFVKNTAGFILSKADVVTGDAGKLVKNYEDTKKASQAA